MGMWQSIKVSFAINIVANYAYNTPDTGLFYA
jgi:hypothetical protein